MIEQMKKVSLVVLDSTKKDALKKLRSVGVLHLETVTGNSTELFNLKSDFNKLETASMLLSDLKVPKNAVVNKQSLSREQAIEKADDVIALFAAEKNAFDEMANDSKELERFSAWGSVNPEDFGYLKTKNVFVSMYEIPSDKYKAIPEDIKTIFVNGNKSQTRFLLLTESTEKPANLPAEAYAVPFGEFSTDALKDKIAENQSKLNQIAEDKIIATGYIDSLKQAMKIVSKEIEFENVYSGMDAEDSGSHALAWLTGYVPTADLEKFSKTAKEQNWAFIADDPAEEDEVPTKLKNNKFVSLIYPVSDFLGTVPGYREYDISGWFLLFFSVFFGIIFGDGGYGLLMVLVAFIGMLKAVTKKQKPGTGMFLLLILGLTTMVWGALTCNWFGIAPDKLPAVIKPLLLSIDWNLLSNASTLSADTVKQNLQVFCFTLALVQLSVAHFKGIKRNIRSLKMLGELGSLAMLWGIYYLVLNMVVDGERFSLSRQFFGIAINTPMFALIGGGFALNFIFSNYEGKIGQSILASCKNIISVLLGVVNVFSDIVSYIRLWAVGLAGSAISSTVNQMAGPTLGGALIFAGILLLVFGHGLNMILNVLSVIVHGVRLNTLEFSSHLGMSWSGFSYQPFSEKADK